MVRTLLLASLLVELLCLAAAVSARPQETTRVSAVPPVILPAPQTSVTSTAFNPNIQNPGGTTNSAGTFDVQSLARSSNYVYDSNIPQTSTYAETSAPIANDGNADTPSYYSNSVSTPSAPIVVSQEAPSRVTSLLSTSDSNAPTTPSSNAASALLLADAHNGLGTVMLMGAAAVLGAVVIL